MTPPSRCGSSIRTCGSSPADRAARSCRRISPGTAKCSRSATTRWTASRSTPTTATRKEWSGNSTARFLAMNLDMDRHIHEIAAVCDYVQGLQKSSKRLWLSFDEWNVWYRARDAQATDGKRAAAPPLLEEVYNLEDALLVGGFVNTLLRNSDRVRVGCLAQLVNVIAPLVTNDSGVLRQSTYYPVRLGACATRAAACSICASSRRPTRSKRPACRPISRVTATCRSSTSSRRSTSRGQAARADAQPRSRRRARGRARVGGRRARRACSPARR